MTFAGWARRCAIGFLLGLGISGCVPGSDSQLEEKNEPHFIAGKNLVEQRDYQGAIDEFEKALEVNPRSASAHFELAWLAEDKIKDPAAAIYHYDRYLKFSPNPDKADLVRQHSNLCKLELARTVSATGSLAPPAQRELERVVLENKDLQAQVVNLQAQLAQAKNAGATVPLPKPPGIDTVPKPLIETKKEAIRPVDSTAGKRPAAAARTYTIKSGETIASIARKSGVSINALLAANPHVRPTRIVVGQVLTLPSP